MMVLVPLAGVAQKKKIKKANEETASWRYEIENVTIGQQGNVVIKVWSYSKDTKVAAEQSKKNAVHGVIFKGIPARERTQGKKPLVEDSAKESQYADFFTDFFANGGDYMRFVSFTNTGDLGSGDVLKIDKKEYKVGVVVTVNYNDLRAHLENKGIVRKLGSGF